MWDFLRSVSVHFGSVSQNVLKLILKSPTFVPFGANLTKFGGKQTRDFLGWCCRPSLALIHPSNPRTLLSYVLPLSFCSKSKQSNTLSAQSLKGRINYNRAGIRPKKTSITKELYRSGM